MITVVDSQQDPRLDPFRWRDRQLASKLDRLETVGAGLFVAEGDLVVQRAIAAGCTPVALLCEDTMGAAFEQQLKDVAIYIGSEDLRREVTGLGVPLKAVGLFRRPGLIDPAALIRSSQRIVVAEALDNPTNLGAIIRSATALGWDGLLLTEGSADPLARRALRVSMGTGLQLAFARHENSVELHEMLQANNCITVALTPHKDAQDINATSFPPEQKIALLLGSERDGLTTQVLARAHHQLRIPMFDNTDSLNVAAAAAIALFALGPAPK
jgi:tRNA G18 (ribose-2'-O)-methylase SpoU